MKKRFLIFTVFIAILSIFSACNTKGKSPNSGKKILYYTDAMHPSVHVSVEDYNKGDDTCPICFMPLIPVYEQDKDSATNLSQGEAVKENHSDPRIEIRLSSRDEIMADIATVKVEKKTIHKMIRTSGTIEFDERKVSFVSAYIGGRIDKLYINFTGANVYKGQALGKIYSPDLVSTQEEYIAALNRADQYSGSDTYRALVNSARQRLLLWGVSEKDIQELEASRKPKLYLTIYSPMSGVVIEKNVREGEYVKEGQSLYKIANLSKVWVQTDVFEYELPYVKIGQKVEISSVSFPDRTFMGYITFIDPLLNPQTRSVKVRVEINNSGMQLKPGMFVTSSLMANFYQRTVVPKTALLDTGLKKVVYVKVTNTSQGGIYSPRLVDTGIADDKQIEILAGLKIGEDVVMSGAFLLDSHAELSGANASGGYGGALKVESAPPAHNH